MKVLKILVFTFTILGCNFKEAPRIKRVEVYSVSTSFNFPISIKEKSIKELEPIQIVESENLIQIEKLLAKLAPFEDKGYSFNDTRLLCNVVFSNRKTTELKFDGFVLLYEGRFYQKDCQLLQLLTSSSPKWRKITCN